MHGVVMRAVEAVRGIADETGTPLELELPAGVLRRGRPAPRRAHRAQPRGQRDRPQRGQAGARDARRPTSTPSRCWSATTASACAPARRAWCSTGSGGPRSRGPGAAAAAGWGCRSPSRTPGCTAAGCRRGASSGKGAVFRLTLPRERRRRHRVEPAAARPGRSPPRPPPSRPRCPPRRADARSRCPRLPTCPRRTCHERARERSWTQRPATGVGEEPAMTRRPRRARAGPPARARRPGRLRERAGELAGAGAAPGRRRRGRARSARPGRRQQPARPRARLRVRVRQQHRPARRRPPRSSPPTPPTGTTPRASPCSTASSTPCPRRAPPDPSPGVTTIRIRGTAIGRLTSSGSFEPGAGHVPAGRRRRAPRRPVADLPTAGRRRRAAVDLPGQLPHGAHLVRRPGAPARRRRRALRAERAGAGRRPRG